MKIGIYGGSFNPVHNNHKELAELVLKENIVDEIWLMPCKDHPFNKTLAPEEHRVEMLKLAFQNMDRIKIDYTELNSNEKNYTAKTIKTLKKQYEHEFYFIAGTDSINSLEEWYDSEYLKENLKFIGVKRKDHEVTNTNFNLETIIDSDMSISSTQVRTAIAQNEPITHLVNNNVEKYMMQQNLYKQEIFKNPSSTVDLIVPIKEGLLYIQRKNEPYQNHWALPGGFINYGEETLEEAGARELFEETNLKTKPEYLKLIGNYSAPKRDPRSHTITHVYEVTSFTGHPKANDDAKKIAIFKEIPKQLAFDHEEIIKNYYQEKSNKVL